MYFKNKNVSVQETNDSSIVSKLSAENKAYYNDEFLQYFVNKSQNRSPLINRGYYIRFKAMESAFESWFDALQKLSLNTYQVISLGAGFDTTFFRLKKNDKLTQGSKYIEVDFPEVVQRKCLRISASEELQKCLFNKPCDSLTDMPEINVLAEDYVIIGLDLKNLDALKTCLQVLKIDFDIPTLFVAECSIAYMDVKWSDKVISWASVTFPNSAFAAYEQIYPNDGFGLVMQNHFLSLGSPIKSIKHYPDLESQKQRFLCMGWSICVVKDVNSIWDFLPRTEKNRISNIELFDEYETWHQKCGHYALIFACRGILASLPVFENDKSNWTAHRVCSGVLKKQAPVQVQRYGHQSVLLSPDLCLISGGFGHFQQKHGRLKILSWMNLKTGTAGDMRVKDFDNHFGARMHHSMASLSDGRIVIYGGRSSPKKPFSNIIVLKLSQNDITSVNLSDPEILSCEVIESKGSQPLPRWRHSCSVVSLEGTDLVFIFGGCTATSQATDDCFILNTITWDWNEVPQEGLFPVPCHSHASTSDSNNQIFISGGLNSDEEPLNTIHVFNVAASTWSKLEITNLLPRYSHISHIVQNQLWLIGGVSKCPGVVPFISQIDLTSLVVEEFLHPSLDPEYPILLHNHQSLLCSNNQIVTLGGGGNCFSFGTHFNQQILTITLNDLS